ncbi:MAG: hypothetical protein J6Z49_11540 [Kiritimatiellae bacterium]|nr:hypothetical protein [Kiritimatiellia bacterium]
MRHLIPVLLLAAVLPARSADPVAVRLFEANRDAVFAADPVVRTDGYTFLTIRIDANDADFRGAILERKTVERLAQMCVTRNAESAGAQVSKEVQQMLTRSCLLLERTFSALAPYALDSDASGKICVWGLPDTAFDKLLPTWAKIQTTLCNPANFSSPDFLPGAVMEIVPAELQIELRKEFIRRMQQRHGSGCALLFSQGILLTYSPGMAQTLTREFLRDAAVSDLFAMVNILPGDPRVLAALARRFDQRGMHTAAQWFASRGGLDFLDYASSRVCADIVAKGTLFKVPHYSEDIALEPFSAMIAKADFSDTPVEIFNQWRRPFPGGLPGEPDAGDLYYAEGKRLFQAAKPDLEGAYSAFLASAARSLSFYACDYAGVCAAEGGHLHEAAFLFLQAAAANPSENRDWPWTNLACLARRENEEKAFAYCLAKLRTCRLSEWSRQKLRTECGVTDF